MKEFRGIDIDARELVRNLGRFGELRTLARPIEREDIGRPLAQNAVRALWSVGDGLSPDLPSVLLSSEPVLADLLPRMLALPGVVTPITSLMKAWQIEDFRDCTEYGERPLSRAAVLGFVGLIVGELKATIGPDADFRLMGMDSVRRTMSFACAQAVMKGWRHESLAIIVERWLEASVLTANDVDVASLIPVADVGGFLQALSDLGESQDASPQALGDSVQSWVDARNNLNQRDLLKPALSQYARSLSGVTSREQRYDLIMEALDRMRSSAETPHSLERGFLISLIEPGSFDFLELATRADKSGGAVATAYCAFAAILGKEATLSKFGGFGWNVMNHGFRVGVEMPMDISIAELRILHNMRRDAPIAFRTRSPSLVDVEIAPMVTGSFGNSSRRKTSSQKVEEESDNAERDEALRERLATALRAVEEAYSIIAGRKPRHDRKTSPQRRLSK
ncbi:hypothetical protein [Piscinibacter sakaiensis]|uniref:hypothetical protein n=1 Tax=Piscinibacter sakaiensis TaxID=1547922 RepID=UPI003AAC9536